MDTFEAERSFRVQNCDIHPNFIVTEHGVFLEYGVFYLYVEFQNVQTIIASILDSPFCIVIQLK